MLEGILLVLLGLILAIIGHYNNKVSERAKNPYNAEPSRQNKTPRYYSEKARYDLEKEKFDYCKSRLMNIAMKYNPKSEDQIMIPRKAFHNGFDGLIFNKEGIYTISCIDKPHPRFPFFNATLVFLIAINQRKFEDCLREFCRDAQVRLFERNYRSHIDSIYIHFYVDRRAGGVHNTDVKYKISGVCDEFLSDAEICSMMLEDMKAEIKSLKSKGYHIDKNSMYSFAEFDNTPYNKHT